MQSWVVALPYASVYELKCDMKLNPSTKTVNRHSDGAKSRSCLSASVHFVKEWEGGKVVQQKCMMGRKAIRPGHLDSPEQHVRTIMLMCN